MALKLVMVLVLTLSAFGIGGKLPRPTAKLQEPRTVEPRVWELPQREGNDADDRSGQCGHRRGTKIVGGHEATRGSWPWQAKLFVRSNSQYYLCGGTLVANNWVVTAAHCTENAEAIYISLGAHCYFPACSDEQTFWASQIISHPSYNKYHSHTHDIAMLKLPSPARITDNVNLACLPQSSVDVAVGKTCWVTGFGDTSPKSNVLMEVSLPIVSRATCQAAYPHEDIDQSMICAGNSEGGKDACKGDSGGPMVCEENGKFFLEGVVSWGYGCARPGLYGVYADVRYFRAWIDTTMSGN